MIESKFFLDTLSILNVERNKVSNKNQFFYEFFNICKFPIKLLIYICTLI